MVPKVSATDVVPGEQPGFDMRHEEGDRALRVRSLEGGELLLEVETGDGRVEFQLEPEAQANLMMGLYVCWLNRGGPAKDDFGFVSFRPKGD